MNNIGHAGNKIIILAIITAEEVGMIKRLKGSVKLYVQPCEHNDKPAGTRMNHKAKLPKQGYRGLFFFSLGRK